MAKVQHEVQYNDVLIVGAGLSGICAACYLQDRLPGLSYEILEGRAQMGGTWDLFRYPGIRSDSDMYTLGYSFRPWSGEQAIAQGGDILRYLEETAQERGVDKKIRYQRRVVEARWSSADNLWTLTVEDAQGQRHQRRCKFFWACTGYYSYQQGYTPDLPGLEDFKGDVIHPQHWDQGLDHGGKRVVVIGSGATAVTLVPALAQEAAHVTMLQRSPTYIVSMPSRDATAAWLKEHMPEGSAYQLTRGKNILYGIYTYFMSRSFPRLARHTILKGVQEALGQDYEIAPHFTPSYKPWDQRVCLVPDGDLFEAIRAGRAEVVTDHIEAITPDGVRLASGRHLEADLLVTATGLQLELLGGASLWVDDQAVDLSEHTMYRGVMLSDIPNMALCVGYTNASWTLKAELACAWTCRLLEHMQRRGYVRCWPMPPEGEEPRTPLLDLTSGYIRRARHILPRQGQRTPWKLYQNYILDKITLERAALEDGVLRFV
jgi:cation diffusion facilitator CzcD-associated flavoprotein CzcO